MFSMSSSPTKKTFYYNFFPTKEEEESLKGREFEPGQGGVVRTMVEIRDVYLPPVVDPDNPWRIKKTLSHYEIGSGKLVLSWDDTFEHVLRYWSLDWANYIGVGLRVDVGIRDVTPEDHYPRKYDAYLQMGEGDHEFHLMCMALMYNRHLQVYDEVLMYWDSDESCFMFKLLL